MSGLQGKAIAITGAGGGIGRSLAIRLLARGADVFASDLDEASLTYLSEKESDFSGRLQTSSCDVTSRQSLQQFADHVVAERGHIDFWVNNAGITQIGTFRSCEEDTFDKVLDINLHGVIAGTRIALDLMEPRGTGSIVNIASVAGHLPSPYMTAYCASKHGVVGFTRALQAELDMAGSSVSLMLVSPGFANTSIISKGQEHGFPDWLSFMLASADEVADAIVAGMIKGKREIYPTLNGKIMRRLYSLLPRTTVRSSRVLFAKSLKDALLNRIDIPEEKRQLKE